MSRYPATDKKTWASASRPCGQGPWLLAVGPQVREQERGSAPCPTILRGPWGGNGCIWKGSPDPAPRKESSCRGLFTAGEERGGPAFLRVGIAAGPRGEGGTAPQAGSASSSPAGQVSRQVSGQVSGGPASASALVPPPSRASPFFQSCCPPGHQAPQKGLHCLPAPPTQWSRVQPPSPPFLLWQAPPVSRER